MTLIAADLTHAFRRLRRSPGFAITAILTLALGIGLNTAIFSVVRSVLLAPLPYTNPDRVAVIWTPRGPGQTTWLSAPEILDYQADTKTFAGVAAYSGTSANITGGLEPERLVAAAVTPNLFATLGVKPAAGRLYEPNDDIGTLSTKVILGYDLWLRRFNANPAIIGATIQVNGVARTVLGVTPATFRLPRDFADDHPTEFFTALDLAPNAAAWGDHSYIGVARLAPGVATGQANAVLTAFEERWVRDGHWQNRTNAGRAAIPAAVLILGDVRGPLLILLAAVGVILLIACANVTNLVLANADDRYREVALRTALGAERTRIIVQLASETGLLAIIGGVAGVMLAWGATRLIPMLRPGAIPRIANVHLDGTVLGGSLLLTAVTGLLVGLAPAMHLSHVDLGALMKDGARGGTAGAGRQRLRDGLSVAQIAFSVVLLVGALLLGKSFAALREIDLGFHSNSALTFRMSTPVASYPKGADVIRFYQTLRTELAALPDVKAVGATRILPLTGTIGDWSIRVEGHPAAPGENPNGDWQVVTPGYFESMGIAMASGRTFTDADNEQAPIVAVVNETMAARYWPNENPIGRRFAIGSLTQPWMTIVGVSRAVHQNAVTEGARAEMYVPHAQWEAAGASTPRAMTLVIRTGGNPRAILPRVRAIVRGLDPGLPIANVRTLSDVTDASLAQPRFDATLFGLFAALALALAAIGVYGVISLLVTRRRREIGIRAALGADSRRLVTMVIGRGLGLAATGVVAGLLAAAGLTRVLATMLYSVSPLDAKTFAAAPIALGLVAIVASALPARRAAAVDPAVALRDE